MQLVVSKYEPDKHGSLDCVFCSEDAQRHFTVVSFYDSDTGNTVTVCPEHMDDMVSAALERHKQAMSGREPDPFWYLEEDEDPWL